MRKKLLSLLLALCLACPLAACGGQSNRSLTIFAANRDILEAIDLPLHHYRFAHPEIDLQVLPLPEGCPELQPYEGEDYDSYLLAYLEEVEEYRENELATFYKEIRGQLIAGHGPDLLLFDGAVFPDVHKAVASGVFADLRPLLDATGEFDAADFSEPALAAGQYHDRQYVMPLFYDFAGLCTSSAIYPQGRRQERPNAFDLAAAGTFTGLMEEAARLSEKDQARIFYSDVFPLHWTGSAGLELLDYETGRVDLDQPEFRSIQQSLAALYRNGQLETGDFSRMERWSRVVDGRAQFSYFASLHEGLTKSFSVAAPGADPSKLSPALDECLPVRTVSGGIQGQVVLSAAGRAGSANQQNACDFLMELLVDDFQSGSNGYFGHLPVRTLNVQDRAASIRSGYAASFGQEAPQSYTDNYLKWIGEIERIVFPTDLDDRLIEYFTPYYEGRSPYEECLKQAKAQLMIAVSE